MKYCFYLLGLREIVKKSLISPKCAFPTTDRTEEQFLKHYCPFLGKPISLALYYSNSGRKIMNLSHTYIASLLGSFTLKLTFVLNLKKMKITFLKCIISPINRDANETLRKHFINHKRPN